MIMVLLLKKTSMTTFHSKKKAEVKDMGEGIPIRWAVWINGKFEAQFIRRAGADAYVRHLNKVKK